VQPIAGQMYEQATKDVSKEKMADAISKVDIGDADPAVMKLYLSSDNPAGAIDYLSKYGIAKVDALAKLEEIRLRVAKDAEQRDADREVRREGLGLQAAIAAQASEDRRFTAGLSHSDRVAARQNSGGAADGGRRFTNAQVSNLSSIGENLDSSERILDGFKKEYFHSPITGGRYNPETWRFMPGNTEQKAFWQDYGSSIAKKRHELFGSTLTKNEKDSWEALVVNPGTDPTLAQKNIIKQHELETRAASKIANGMVAQGYNPEAIEEYIGRPLSSVASRGPVTAGNAGYGAPAASAGGGWGQAVRKP
jgi:hypothetical protein